MYQTADTDNLASVLLVIDNMDKCIIAKRLDRWDFQSEICIHLANV